MTKQEFIERVASKSGLSRRDAAKAVDAFLDSVTETLKRGDEVTFTGFGKFTAQRRAERQGVNPRNPSQKVTIPAASVPKFSAGSALRDAARLRSEAKTLKREHAARRSRVDQPLAALRSIAGE